MRSALPGTAGMRLNIGDAMATILVIDDSATARKWIAREIRKILPAAEIAEAPSGDAAYIVVQTRRFDLVTVDFNMPGMNGLEFIEKFRALNHDTPLVMITANLQQTIVDRARALKTEVVGKPITEAALKGIFQQSGLLP